MLASLFWTPGLIERFESTNHYDLRPYLPLLFKPSNTWGANLPIYNQTFSFGTTVGGGEGVFQLDYRKVLNDGYQEYIQHFREWAHSIGTEYSHQPAYNLPLQAVSFLLPESSISNKL